MAKSKSRKVALAFMAHPDDTELMSLLADHPNVHFHYYRPALGTVQAQMH